MDHFKSAHLKNFGPWKDQKIEFHPGVNVIIGESGHGKSALLKSLDFVLNNKTPKSAQGNLGFITRPEERGKFAEVSIEMLSDEKVNKISRRKGKSINEYQLNDDTPQKAMGVNVPDHIAKIINMSSVNYHKQKHLPFLLDENPGQVAKQLTGIINLEEIDESVKLAKQTTKENNKILEDLINEDKELSDKINNLGYVSEFKAEIDNFLDYQKDYYKQIEKFDKVDSILYEIDNLEAQKDQFKGLIALGDMVDAIELKNAQFEAESAKFDKVLDIVEQIDYLQSKQKRNKLLIELGNKVDMVEESQQDFKKNKQKYKLIEDCLNGIDKYEQTKQQLLDKIKTNQAILDKMQCPTCGYRRIE